MRHFVFALISLLTIACSNRTEKDFSELDELHMTTDSLLHVLKKKHERISKNLYLISDDSLKRDLIIEEIDLPDSIGFYQYIEKSLNELNEIYFQTQQEIYFAKDQLNSVKSEYSSNNISETEYINEINELKNLIRFLNIRVDSNVHYIRSNYHYSISINDSLQ